MISKVITFTAALVFAVGLGVSAQAGAVSAPEMGVSASAPFKQLNQLVHKANFKKHKKIKTHRGGNKTHQRFNRHRSFDRFDKFYRRNDFGHRKRLHPKSDLSSGLFSRHKAPKTAAGLLPWTPAWHRHCVAKYKSFNPKTGTYLTFSGHRKFCS